MRDLRLPRRTAQQNADAAAITQDDIERAREAARADCTPLYRRFLIAGTVDDSAPERGE